MSTRPSTREEIIKVVKDEWNRPQGGPLLISKLGMRLSPEAKEDVAASGYGLKRYIQEFLADDIRFVPMRSRGGGVVPLLSAEDLSDQQIEERYVDRPEKVDVQNIIPMYWGDVWRGFQTPLPEETVRYILLEAHGKPEVGTSPKGAAMPANAKLIDPNDLVTPKEDGSLPPRIVVHQAIENWCRREGVPVSSLIFTRPQAKEFVAGAQNLNRKSAVGAKTEKNFSSSLGLNLLTREELARINIPADLVLAIFERASSK